MKPGLTLFAALAGLGIWLYVQLAPYPVDQRWSQFQRLPGVEKVVEWNDMRPIKAEFRQAENGTISVSRRGEVSTWASFEEWKADFDAYDRSARYWYNRVRNSEAFDKLDQQADSGSLAALRTLALMGIGQTSSGASIADLLKQNGSATAQLTLQQFVTREVDPGSREGMLLNARAMLENYRWEGTSDEQFAKSTALNQQGLAVLKHQAERGDPDALWVWGRIHGDTPAKIIIND